MPDFILAQSRFCKKCQIETERQSSGNCKACAKKAVAAWRAANTEKHRAAAAAWKVANIENIKAYAAAYYPAYYDAHKDKIKATTSAYYAANPEKAKVVRVAWAKDNPEKMKAYNATYHAANPEAERASRQNRRARLRAAEGSITKADVTWLFDLQRGTCPACKADLNDGYHVDHIQALSRGGSNARPNLQLLCPTCNLSKSARDPLLFMQSRGFLL